MPKSFTPIDPPSRDLARWVGAFVCLGGAIQLAVGLSSIPEKGLGAGAGLVLLANILILVGVVYLVRLTTTAGRAARVERDERFAEISRRLDLALEVSQIGFWDVDLDTDTLSWDARACQLMGVPERGGYFTEADWLSAVHPQDRNRTTTAAEAAIKNRGQFVSDYRVVWPNGEVRHLRDMAAYYQTTDGRPRIAGLVWDVTNDKEREAELDLRRQESERANKAKSSFLAAMSHEIRTPLAGVMGMLELMQSDDLSEEQSERARIASASAANLLQLLNDLLDLSKLEAASVTLAQVPVDLRALVGDVADLMSARAAQKGIEVSHAVEADVPAWVSCDPVRFRQVLVNVVSNAVTYTDEGSVSVEVATTKIAACGGIEVLVRDTGIGIDETDRERVFERFVQADAATKRQAGGTGLGLAIARELAELMGGRISVESVPGVGSTFKFSICAEACDAPKQLPSVAEPVPGRPLDILVAEDNSTNRFLINSLLGRGGHRVTMVRNGREAVEAVQAGDYDVVLMDVQMPEMDGLEASEAIRALDEPLGRVPIIALTASVLADDRARCLAAGMNDCLAKPIDVSVLRAVLARSVLHVGVDRAERRIANSA